MSGLFVRIDPEEAAALKAALAARKTGVLDTSPLEALLKRYDDGLAATQEHASVIATARTTYADRSNHNIEIDDMPAISTADDGAWLNAWMWVPNTSH